MAKILGIDQGVASIGWGIIDTESNEIVDAGVRLFDEADKANNEKRRSFRSSRRLKRRRATRKEDVKKILQKYGLYKEYSNTLNPYECRKKGLTSKLSLEELTCAIFNISKHRGSSLDTVEDDDTQKLETSTKYNLSLNDEQIKNGKYVCEIQLQRLNEDGKLRGISNVFRSTDYEKELIKILETQSIEGDAKNEIINRVLRRRHFSEGPGSFVSQTPYGRIYDENGNVLVGMIEKMTGHCSIYPDELRAPKYSPTAEFFNLMNDLNNLRVDDEPIDVETKQKLVKVAFEKGSITPLQIAKELQTDLINIDGFRIDKSEKPIITKLEGFNTLRKLFNEYGYGDKLSNFELLDEIISILTKTKVLDERIEGIIRLDDDFSNNSDFVDKLININKFSAYHSLSFKALRELNEDLYSSQYNQSQILHLSNKYEFRKNKLSQKGNKKICINDEAILSPVALRSYRQAIKVINQARKIYGEFDSIVIETTRDKNSMEQKKRISDAQKFFEDRNKRVNEIMENYPDIKLNGKLREKLVLYEEQQGKTAYTQQPINIDTLINDPYAYEVDHIIPISISLDDSINNKTLASSLENQEKKNCTPIMAFDSGLFSRGSKEEYLCFIKSLKLSKKKYNNYFYAKDINKYENMKDFVQRNLVDTSYANRLLLNTLMDYFKDNNIDTVVHTVKGVATNRFRKYLMVDKDRDKDYSHHAIDALLIASIKKMKIYNKALREFTIDEKDEKRIIYNRTTGEVVSTIEDYDLMDSEIKFIKAIGNYEVSKYSWAKDTKPNRSISDQTIYSTRTYDNEDYVIKKYKDIYAKKMGSDFCPVADMIMNGEAKDKLLIYRNDPQSAQLLENVVLHYYDLYKNDKDKIGNINGKIKFKFNPFNELLEESPNNYVRKYSKNGKGPIIRSLKYIDGKLGTHIDISANYDYKDKKIVLLQLSPYRTDFYNDNGFIKFVTIRYSDVTYDEKTKKYTIDANWYQEQKDTKRINENAEFLFSLHHNELIKIDDDTRDDKVYRFRATKYDLGNLIEMKPIDYYETGRITKTIGKKVNSVTKYECDSLGNLYEAKGEKLRLSF